MESPFFVEQKFDVRDASSDEMMNEYWTEI
jgi:hypothetical protein